MVFAVSAQTTLRSPDDNRNLAPTVGTGGVVGGPTGLFITYDGQTLRRGEYTFSIAYSNFDRDPGNADFTEIPISFNIGLSDHLELFFTTDAYRGVKVNNPQNLSSFYLPNSQLPLGTLPAAIVLAPGTTGGLSNRAAYRPAGMPFSQFPFTGSAGTYGLINPFFSGAAFVFGNNPGGSATLGPPRAGGAADNFPGVGSVYGSILPGFVLSTQNVNCVSPTGATAQVCGTAPVAYSVAPSYLPDAPFINRSYGQSAFGTYNAGLKWRFSSPKSAFGWGLVAFYRWYGDHASDFAGFNQLQRGASPGGNRGDIGVGLFADSRAATWANVSANATYIYNSSVKGEFPNGTFTLLDRPDEFRYGVGVDFPVNKFFQPMLEYGQTLYVGGRTPNAFENNPLDLLGGVRIYPARWWGIGLAYRYHANSQDDTNDAVINQSVSLLDYQRIIANNGAGTIDTTQSVVPTITLTSSGSLDTVFRKSTDPHGFIFQLWAGRRNATQPPVLPAQVADVTSLDFDQTEVVLPCPPGTKSRSNGCVDDRNVGVRAAATNPQNDPLTYNYTVSGGRIVGSGAGVNWDLSGVKAGTYTITAAVDNGCGFCGKTQTKSITVRDCPDCVPICDCPSGVSVTGPSGLTKPGDSMTFTASVNGGSQSNPSYNWTVSSGNITSGQGTNVITVATTTDMQGQTVTATVVATGFCAECNSITNSASGEVDRIPPPKEPRKVTDQGPAPDDDVKATLMNIRDTELGADPTATLWIINRGSAKDKAKRVKQLNKAITFLGIESTRVNIVDAGEGTPLTEYWIVPAGAAEPPH